MSHTIHPAVPEREGERALLEAAVAEARNDPRPAVPHGVVRGQMLAEIDRLKRKAALLPVFPRLPEELRSRWRA